MSDGRADAGGNRRQARFGLTSDADKKVAARALASIELLDAPLLLKKMLIPAQSYKPYCLQPYSPKP